MQRDGGRVISIFRGATLPLPREKSGKGKKVDEPVVAYVTFTYRDFLISSTELSV